MDDLPPSAEPTSAPQPSLGLRRLLVRIATFAVVLIAVDTALAAWLGTPDYADDWRLPRVLPTSELGSFARYFEASTRVPKEPVVTFVGASPSWGDAVKDPHLTVPAWYGRAAADGGTKVRVFNFASNGQLMGDEYFVARKVAPRSDLVVVQLTYHAFNSSWRDGATRRYPEVPGILGVPVDAQVARVLGSDSSPRFDLTGSVDRWLQARWRLYGSRDAIAAKTLRATPENALFEEWQKLVIPDYAGEQQVVPSGARFDELSPDEQMLIIDEFSAAADFDFDARDSEVEMLARLAADLQKDGVRAVFYISPLNVEALQSFDLFDKKRYDANVAPLRRIVESRGHVFVDMNAECSVPASAFADVNHTTADGSKLVAGELWKRTSKLVGQ